MQATRKYLSTGYVIFILLFAFFSLQFWHYFKFDLEVYGRFPKSIFHIIGIGIPSLIFLAYQIFNKGSSYKVSFTDVFFLLFVGWSFVSVFYAVNRPLVLEGFYFRCCIFLVYLCAKIALSNHPEITNRVIKNGLLILGLFFIGHYLIGNFEEWLKLVDSDTSYQRVVRKLRSLIGTKNATGFFLLFIFILHYSFFSAQSKYKYLHHAFQALSVFTMILIGSRNVYISLAVFFIVNILLNRKAQQQITFKRIAIIAGIFVVFFLAIDTSKFIKHLSSDTLTPRLMMWEAAKENIAENPILGLGTFQYQTLPPVRDATNHIHPHNDYLRIWLENGIIGLLLWIMIWLIPFFKGILQWRLGLEADYQVNLIGLLAGLISFLSLLVFDGMLFNMPQQILVVLLIAKLDQSVGLSFTNTTLEKGVRYFMLSAGIFMIICGIFYSGAFLKNRKIHESALLLKEQKKYNPAIDKLKLIDTDLYHNHLKLPVMTEMGLVKKEKGKLEAGVQDLNAALDQYPFNEKTLTQISKMLIAQNKNDQAIPYLEKLLIIDQFNEFALYKCQKYYKRVKDEQKLKEVNHIIWILNK